MTPALPALPGTLAASLVLKSARPVDSGPSASDWLPPLIALAVAFGAIFACNQPRRHREAPLRREMRGRAATFRAEVSDVKMNFLGQWVSVGGLPFDVVVHGDVFKVSQVFPPGRWFGQEWCYRAGDAMIEVVPGWRHDWIRVAAQPPAGRATQIRLGRKNKNRQIWDALVRAGVHPVGAPPL